MPPLAAAAPVADPVAGSFSASRAAPPREADGRSAHADPLLAHELAGELEVTRALREQARAAREELPPRAFAKAAVAWIGGVFALCYLALPALFQALRLSPEPLWLGFAGDLVGFFALGGGLLSALVMRSWGRGPLQVHLADLAESDRIPAAAAGGLMLWGLAHNALPGLMPFAQMGWAYLGAFVGANVLENLLFGVLVATLSASRAGAFVRGAAVQGVLLGSWALL